MENRINIAQILSECPKNTKLYSPIFGDVYFYSISPYAVIKVTLNENGKSLEQFFYDGKYTQNGECMLFPSKEQRDWSKFQKPFRNGDVIYNPDINAISILRSNDSEKSISHAFLNTIGDLIINHYHSSDLSDWRFATEEEKSKLFKAIKDHGYVWNSETKTFGKLIEPKFKVGDKIRHKTNNKDDIYEISKVYDDSYGLVDLTWVICMKNQDNYELVPDKFDIDTLKPFDRVLVRGDVGQKWTHDFFGFMDEDKGYPFVCVGHYVTQCIPYEGNEHLLGKTGSCNNFYKIW